MTLNRRLVESKNQIPDLLTNRFWSIHPDSFDALINLSNSIDFSAQNIDDDDYDENNYVVDDGVAIIDINGIITRRPSFFSKLFGWKSNDIESLSLQINKAAADDKVSSILLNIDSPGGVVSGTPTLSDLIKNIDKPVVAYVDGAMVSASYWIGSAADKIFVSKSSQVGSIGVIYTHIDFSELDGRIGIKRTILTAGKYKSVGNDSNPLSDGDKRIIQSELDEIYDLFIESVANNRNVDFDVVKNTMADGKIFIGQKSVDIGLVDAIGTFGDAVKHAKNITKISIGGHEMPGEEIKTIEELKEKYANLVVEIESAAKASVDVESAVKNERDRILGLANAHFGAESGEQFKKIIISGVTIEQYEAIKPMVETSSNDNNAAALAALAASGAGNPGHDNGDDGNDKKFETLIEEQKASGKSYTEAIRIVVSKHPGAHKEYVKRMNASA